MSSARRESSELVSRNEIADLLRQSRKRIEHLVAPRSPGVYAIFLVDGKILGPYRALPEVPIYIGATTNLNDREFEHHFSTRMTGFSSPRRSVGAILRDELRLKAIPRAPGSSESNIRNYRFESDGEVRLSAWMKANLLIGIYACDDPFSIEADLLNILSPLLNLKGCPNSYRPQIKLCRKACADEARNA